MMQSSDNLFGDLIPGAQGASGVGASVSAPTPSAPAPRQIVAPAPPKAEGPPSGYRYNAAGQLEPIPGGPADPTAKNPPKTPEAIDRELKRLSTFRSQIRETLPLVKPSTTGAAALTGAIPYLSSTLFPEAATLRSRLGGITGGATLEYLKDLRPEGATGSLLGGQVSNADIAIVERAAANVDVSQTQEELQRNLLRLDAGFDNLERKLSGKPSLSFQEYMSELSKQETQAPKVGEISTEAGAITSKADPALAGTNAKVRAMLKAGVPQNVIVDYLNSVRPGLGDGAVPSLSAVERWKAANPDYKGGFKVDLEKEYYRTTPTQSFIGRAATSAPGAYAIQAANTLTAGMLPSLTARPEETRAIISGLEETQGPASLAGQVTGSLVGAALPASLLRVAGVGAPLAGVAGEAAFGGATGAVAANEGERAQGAFTGAGLSVLGSALGAGVTKLAADIVSPAISKEVRLAAQSDVPMSLGTMLGGTYKAFEDRVASVAPFFDRKLRAINTDAADKAQRAVFNEVLSPLGEKLPDNVSLGSDAINYFVDPEKGLFNKKYSELYSQMRYRQTPEQEGAIKRLVDEVNQSGQLDDDEIKRFNSIVSKAVINPINRYKGYMSGEEFGGLMSDLKTIKRTSYKKSDALGAAINDLQGVLEEGAIASTPSKEVGKRYRDLSDAYRRFLIVEKAATSKTGELGEFTGQQLINVAMPAEGGRAVVSGRSSLANLANMMRATTTPPASGGSQLGGATTATLGLGAVGGLNLPAIDMGLLGAGSAILGAAATPFIAGSSRRLNPAMRALVAGQRPQAVQSIADITRRAVAPAAAAYGRQTLLDQYAQTQEQERLRRMAQGF
jgi:hypothetical protein